MGHHMVVVRALPLALVFLFPAFSNADNPVGLNDYATHCATCHRLDGAGSPPTIPALDGSPLVIHAEPDILVKLILEGGFADLAMPRFEGVLTHTQATEIANYIKKAWSNQSTQTGVQSNRE